MILRGHCHQPCAISSMKLPRPIMSIANNWSARAAIFVAMTRQASAFAALPIRNPFSVFRDDTPLKIIKIISKRRSDSRCGMCLIRGSALFRGAQVAKFPCQSERDYPRVETFSMCQPL
jgi:hypothetical protein